MSESRRVAIHEDPESRDALLAEQAAELAERVRHGERINVGDLDLGDPWLGDELRRLLPALRMMADLAGPAPGESIGRRGSLGDFRIIREIGRGGMGVVYDAVQVSLNRRVALKILPTVSAGDPRKLRRFRVEAQAAACLHHPHIVPVYLVGSEGDAHYYAMQLIEGQTLAGLLAASGRPVEAKHADAGLPARRRPDPLFAAELAQQAADALHYAHEQGILHRDVKPSNLLIDDSGWLWVADFGLARISGEGDLTATGALIGTLRYTSPEQLHGPRAVVDHRADIYSLGATLYELIALRPAFEGDDRFELLRRIAHDEPRAPRRMDPSIPRDLETIVLKAMAKEPAERYATAREMADDLGRFLGRRPILARPPNAIDRASKWVRRNKPAVAAAVVLILGAVAILGGVVLWRDDVLRRHNRELTSALDRARSAFELAERNETTSRRLWYASQMRLAQQVRASGQAHLAPEILDGLKPEPGRLDLRGFEWHYLRRACDRDVSVLSRHESAILSLARDPDGRTLATADSDGVIVLWDLAAEREHLRFRGHARAVDGLWFSPDGQVLASCSTVEGKPSEVKLWDRQYGRLLGEIPGIRGNVSVAFSSGARALLISEYGSSRIRSPVELIIWDLSRGAAHPVPLSPPIPCATTACSPDGQLLATHETSGTLTIREAATGRSIRTIPGPFPWIASIAFSPDGRTMALDHGSRITMWDVGSGRGLGAFLARPTGPLTFSPDGNRLAAREEGGGAIILIKDIRADHGRVPLSKVSGSGLKLAFSADGRTLAAGGIDLAPTLWDSATGQKLAVYPAELGGVGEMLFDSRAQSLYFANQDGRLRCWNFGRGVESTSQLAGHEKEVWVLAYTPDGATLASASDDATIKLWDARDGGLRSTLKGHDSLVMSVAIRQDGRMLASAGYDGTVRLWELPEGRPLAVLRGHTDRVRAVAFSPDGRHLASAGSDKTVRVWDVDRGETLLVFEGHTDAVRALAFAPDGRRLLSASNDRTIRGIDLDGGREAFVLSCPKPNSSLAFSPDGTLLASGDDWGNVTRWDVATWSRRGSVKESDAEIWGIAFSPDGRTLAAACGDAKVRLCDPITGQVVLVLEGHARRVNAVAFSPDGRTLASASHDGAIKLWQAGPP